MRDVRTNLMIVGAQKAATTTLFDLLASLDGVAGARTKEPHFFATVENWRQRLNEYHRIYNGREGAIRCEASTSYTFFPHRRLELWQDIKSYNPDMRFIYVVRQPTDRIVSHFRHAVRRGYWKGDLHDFVVKNPMPLAVSRYHTQIMPFIETFGREQVLLLDFDEVTAMGPTTRERLANFLRLDPRQLLSAPHVHANSTGTVRHHRLTKLGAFGGVLETAMGRRRAVRAAEALLTRDLERAIERALELEVRALERLMDCDLGNWRRT